MHVCMRARMRPCMCACLSVRACHLEASMTTTPHPPCQRPAPLLLPTHTRTAPPAAAAGGGGASVSAEAVSTLAGMGFSTEQAAAALKVRGHL